MKTIIAGSRNYYDYTQLAKELEHYLENHASITEIVSGGATGTDQLGECFARNFNIPVRVFAANWTEHGRAAGPIRNRQMAQYADALVAFWDFESRGTKNMIEEMKKLDKPV